MEISNQQTTQEERSKFRFHFTVNYWTKFGQNLFVISNHFNNFDPRKGLKMQYTTNGQWQLNVVLTLNPKEKFSYKYCILNDHEPNGGVPFLDPALEHAIDLTKQNPNETIECQDKWGFGKKMVQIPLPGVSGKLFRTPMPFSPMFDPFFSVYQEFQENKIDLIVLLSSQKECEERIGFDLISKYGKDGYAVVYHPWQDFNLPTDLNSFSKLVDSLYQYLKKGLTLAIHCHAGIGRTGLLIACLHKRYFQNSSESKEKITSLEWTRSYIRGAVQTQEQEDFVNNFKV